MSFYVSGYGMAAIVALCFGGGWLVASSLHRDRLYEAIQRFIACAPAELRGKATVEGMSLYTYVSCLRYGLEDFLRGEPARPSSSPFWYKAEEAWLSRRGVWGARYAEVDLPMERLAAGDPSLAHLGLGRVLLPYDLRLALISSLTAEISRLGRGEFRWYREQETAGQASEREPGA